MPHRYIEPRTPTLASVKPSEPMRKPGLHSAMTKPSHQWSDLRSWRSSMTAVATLPSLRPPDNSRRYSTGHLPNQLDGPPSEGARHVASAHERTKRELRLRSRARAAHHREVRL